MPRPNRVKARPEATWFASATCVRKANSNDKVPPPTAAMTNPIAGDPVFTEMINPQTAPVIIIPSTPRFKTPARSATNSPVAAKRIGVAALMRAATSMMGLIAERSIRLGLHVSTCAW